MHLMTIRYFSLNIALGAITLKLDRLSNSKLFDLNVSFDVISTFTITGVYYMKEGFGGTLNVVNEPVLK